MHRTLKQICVYCGAAHGAGPEFARDAQALGRELAKRHQTLVYGGGKVGLMGAVAEASLGAGGQAIGIITHELVKREIGHDKLTELRIVDTMHQRKQMMADLADGFIALPGGVGTLDEFFEIVSWAQLAIHDKPMGLLNTAGFYDPLMEFLDQVQAEGFMRIDPRQAIIVDADPARLLDRMAAWPGIEKRSWPAR